MSEYKLVCDIALDNERFRVWGFAGKESVDIAALKEFIIGFRQSVENGENGIALVVTPEKREEIVRCRDCKHYGLGRRCGWSKRFVTPEGFCAWAERREP